MPSRYRLRQCGGLTILTCTAQGNLVDAREKAPPKWAGLTDLLVYLYDVVTVAIVIGEGIVAWV